MLIVQLFVQLACLVVPIETLSKYDQPWNAVQTWQNHAPLIRNSYIPPQELPLARHMAAELAEADRLIWQKNALQNRNSYLSPPQSPTTRNLAAELAEADGLIRQKNEPPNQYSYVPPPQPAWTRKIPTPTTELAELDGQMEMAAQALELALTSTARIRHIVSAAYRQIKLNDDTPFSSAIAKAIANYTEQMSDETATLGAPDQYVCESLIRKSIEYLDPYEKNELSEYLTWIRPGTELAAREVQGCFTEKSVDPNATFQRLYLRLGNMRVENLIVKALTTTGNEEIFGTRQEGIAEANARDSLKNYVNGRN